MPKDRFTVDTHLFRELGELLVGRDSTALIELVKNAYDADATLVTVHAEDLGDPWAGYIVVRDNGVGMTRKQFRDGFLRIASRMKETGKRQSARLKRRFTGAKGIGRLAAHKLARRLEITSVATDPESGARTDGFVATIDWDRIEKVETLDLIADDAVEVADLPEQDSTPPGTSLTLKRLRRPWSTREVEEFVTQAHSMRPPSFLLDPIWVKQAIDGTLLLDEVNAISSAIANNSWDLQLTGALSIGDPS